MNSPKDYLIWWNNNFPLDRVFREKYKIPFGSKQHLEHCQIDMLYDLLEDKLFSDFMEEQVKEKIDLENYKKGEIFKQSSEDLEDRFNKFLPEDPNRLKIIENNTNPPQ